MLAVMKRYMDVSNYSGTSDVATLSAICNSQNITGIIIACEFPDTLAAWYNVASQVPCLESIESYIELYPGRGTFAEQVQTALDTISIVDGSRISRLWLAFENGTPPADWLAQLRAAVQLVGSDNVLRAGVYTALWYWQQYGLAGIVGDLCPLWHAAYQTETSIPADHAVEYGGWLNARGWQYAGDFKSYNLTFDLSVFTE